MDAAPDHLLADPAAERREGFNLLRAHERAQGGRVLNGAAVLISPGAPQALNPGPLLRAHKRAQPSCDLDVAPCSPRLAFQVLVEIIYPELLLGRAPARAGQTHFGRRRCASHPQLYMSYIPRSSLLCTLPFVIPHMHISWLPCQEGPCMYGARPLLHGACILRFRARCSDPKKVYSSAGCCPAGLRGAERDGGAGLEALVRHAGGTLERAGPPRSAAGAAQWVVLGADAPRERAWAANTLPSGKGLLEFRGLYP